MTATSIDRLFDRPIFDASLPGEEFLDAANECLTILRERFPRYAQFVRDRVGSAFDHTIRSLDQLDALPALFLSILKGYPFDLPDELEQTISVRLTSSGTTGAPSETPLDQENMRRRVDAMTAVYRELGVVSGKMEAIAFLMNPATTHMAGSVVIDAVLRQHPQVQSVHYLARMGETGPQFDDERAVSLIRQAAAQAPVLAVGYPALMASAIRSMIEAGLPTLPLPEGSLVLTGGGWKSFLPGLQLDQREFRSLAAEFFQVPITSIRDMFGLSECPAVFLQCAAGGYHVPAFTWAQAIDPESGQEVSDDEVGFLQLTTPLTTSYPLLRILTTDKTKISRSCSCGRAAPSIVPKGRVTAARFETCAMTIGQAIARS